jgi:multidrug/hemolysin transport system ATP-binding protein
VYHKYFHAWILEYKFICGIVVVQLFIQGGTRLTKSIQVENLVKKYGDVLAVDGISFDVDEGTLFAFLGPNGAGKSSTINAICTTAEITDGKITVAGYNAATQSAQVRGCIGTVFQESVLDDLLTVRENIETRASLYGLPATEIKKRIAEVAEAVSITEILGRRYGQLSGGQRRRADMARGLVHRPKILFLDEPTTGLDPQTRLRVWDTVTSLQKSTGMTVFMTTHYMEEAAGADKVAIIDKGRIAAQGTPEELRSNYSSDYLKLQPKDDKSLKQALDSKGVRYEVDRELVVIRQSSSMDALALLKAIEQYVMAFEVVRGNMDDVFMAVTGHAIREGGDQ